MKLLKKVKINPESASGSKTRVPVILLTNKQTDRGGGGSHLEQHLNLIQTSLSEFFSRL